MKVINQLWRGIAAGGLSLALVGGVGLPSACAACNHGSEKTHTLAEHHREMLAKREQMLARAMTQDATLEKLVTELNRAPEAKKVDLEARILTKLVTEHHQMLAHWEAASAHMAQFRKEHRQGGTMAMSTTPMMHGMTGQTASTAQK